MTINIYTDGAYSSSSKIGGWAFVAEINDGLNPPPPLQLAYNYSPNTTNNQMELQAIIEALEYVLRSPITFDTVTIYTDSAYIANAFKDRWIDKWLHNGWKTASKTPVKNKEQWMTILNLKETIRPTVEILKVEGHSTNKFNNLADELAVKARMEGALYEQQKTQEEHKS